jgi:tetratricopeptide (TPR) repeat protein
MLASARWKLVDAPAPELYDVARDARESSNQAREHTDTVSAMRQRLTEMRSRSTPGAPSQVTPEVAQRLRSLGYVATVPAASTAAPNPAAMMPEWSAFESALARQEDGDGPEALPVFERLARDHGESALFVTTWARALAAAGRHREALKVYRAAMLRWPADSTLAHDLAVSAREENLTAEALTAEQAALAIDPANSLAQNGMGLLLSEAGRQAEARAAFERAVALDPTNATYHVHLGNAARETGDHPAAERAYRAALALDDSLPDALNGLAVLLVQADRPREALPLLERAVKLDPNFGEARLNLGIARQQSGDLTGARSAYLEIVHSPRFKPQQAAAGALLKTLK